MEGRGARSRPASPPRAAPRSAGTRASPTTTGTSSPIAATALYTLQISLFRDRDCRTAEEHDQPAVDGRRVCRGRGAGGPARHAPGRLVQHDHAAARLHRRTPVRSRTRSSSPRAASCRPTAASRRRRSRTASSTAPPARSRSSAPASPATTSSWRAARSGDYYTAWSPPVTMKLIAPFDFSTRTFPDQRGPRYSVRATLREASAAGSRVTVAVAKGKNGKRFRTLGRAKVYSKGVFKLQLHDPQARHLPAPLLVRRQRDGRPRHDLRGRHDPPRARLRRYGYKASMTTPAAASPSSRTMARCASSSATP